MTADEYLEGWRAEYEPRGVWISDEFRRADAEQCAAIDRALGPTPTLADIAELRMWRAGIEAFGPACCNVRHRYLPTRPHLVSV